MSKKINLKAGSIIAFKKHSLLKRIQSWFKREELPYNRYLIMAFGWREYPLEKDKIIFEPVKRYNSKESTELFVQCYFMSVFSSVEELKDVINSVRPNTIVGDSTLENSKFYKKITYSNAN